MKSLTGYALNKAYEQVEKLGDKLFEVNKLIDWEKFRLIVGDMYNNRGEKGGRSNVDEILMVSFWFCKRGMDCLILSLNARYQIGFHL